VTSGGPPRAAVRPALPRPDGSATTSTTAKSNVNFEAAKRAKEDEFYTQLADIERELKHYKRHFKDKVVYCNCDDPRVSNFFHYFSYNFEKLGLKRLISACYKSQERDLFSQNDSDQAIWLDYDGDKNHNMVPDPDEIGVKPLTGDGDFRSAETIELLAQADIVVTNPPFSLFREYVAQLVEHDKKFLILGNMNAVTYTEIWPLIQANKMWLGVTRTGTGQMWFRVNEDAPIKTGQRVDENGVRYQTVGSSAWFTNLDIAKRHEDQILYKTYTAEDYPRYANYDAIDVSLAVNIPVDYAGAMGVPITFLGKHNPDQFEIIGNSRDLGVSMSTIAEKGTYQQGGPRFYLPNSDGTYRRMYERIVIRNKRL
jgi:hypothetical protein